MSKKPIGVQDLSGERGVKQLPEHRHPGFWPSLGIGAIPGSQRIHSGVQGAVPGSQRTHSGVQGAVPGSQRIHSGVQGAVPGSQRTHSGVQGAVPGSQRTHSGVQGAVPGSQRTHSGVQGAVPGSQRLFFILPCTDSFIKVDMRTISFDIPPQEILTKDSVTISVDGVVYYRVQNATLAVANITNADSATRLLAQTTLRNVLGTKNLSQILSDREEIAHNMQCTLDDATDDWGIKVERVEIKDVKLPVQLQRAMAAEAEASREARAKVIAAEGEMNASRALKEASMVITESPAALQLRYLQTLTTIAAEKNSTIIFPLPIDMLQTIMGPKQ
ncbi:hypothetical protein E5288_WYG006766 [Bos mutus]|uniref:Band 7 domain-containing protein n=1 Tax=Bos mutus TaxID=72004 RepID=A0A6B0REA6_9CETA|nr:hypothetical protein [Bos mutus]